MVKRSQTFHSFNPAGFAVFSIVMAICVGCGGKSSSDTSDDELTVIQGFTGVLAITSVEDNAWQLTWDPVDIDGVIYAVYLARDGAAIDFASSPLLTTSQNFYRYQPENIFTEKATCFAVRINNKPGDVNTAQQCTTDTPFIFEGAQTIERQSDGAYLLKWNRIPVNGVIYTIYESKDGEPFDYGLPSFDAITEDFFKTTVFERGHKRCLVVRYSQRDLPADTNTKAVCSELEPPIAFGGISDLDATATTSIILEWVESKSSEIASYRIYQGSDFKELMGTVKAGQHSMNIGGLVPSRQYSFGVRATDVYGREDTNLRILSIVMPHE